MSVPDDLLDDDTVGDDGAIEDDGTIEDFGLVDSLGRVSRVLGVVEDAGLAVKGSKSAVMELRDDVEGIIGAPFLAMEKIDCVREGVGRLVDPRRAKPPGTLETVLEIGGMIFGNKK